MTGTSTPEAMSSRSSHSPAVEMEEPRKKGEWWDQFNEQNLSLQCLIGSRGGKRSVTHLSKAQLARKRANDREAQRNIRQRTKEHIKSLEKKVKELEASGLPSSLERALKRNQELESDIERLRTQMTSRYSTPQQIHSELGDELFTPQKSELDWMPEYTWPGATPSHISALNWAAEIPVSSPMPPAPSSNNGRVSPSTSAPMSLSFSSCRTCWRCGSPVAPSRSTGCHVHCFGVN
jgi:hypothetical protein